MFLTFMFFIMGILECWIANRQKAEGPEKYYTHLCGGIGFFFLAGMVFTTWILLLFPAILFFLFSLFYEAKKKSRD